MYILANGKLITRDGAVPYLPDGGVAIEGTKIAAVGTTAKLREQYPTAEFVDAKGGVIMPGLVNAHTHIYSALARGLSINGFNPTNFYEVLDGQWWYIDRHLTLKGTRASADALYLDCIKQGVTTIFDHHASFGAIPGSLFQIADSAREFGIRSACATRSATGTGRRKPVSPFRRTGSGWTTASGIPAICWRPCLEVMPCLPSATGPSRKWWRQTTAAPGSISMSPKA